MHAGEEEKKRSIVDNDINKWCRKRGEQIKTLLGMLCVRVCVCVFVCVRKCLPQYRICAFCTIPPLISHLPRTRAQHTPRERLKTRICTKTVDGTTKHFAAIPLFVFLTQEKVTTHLTTFKKNKRWLGVHANIRKTKTPLNRGTASIPLLCLSHEKDTTHFTPFQVVACYK